MDIDAQLFFNYLASQINNQTDAHQIKCKYFLSECKHIKEKQKPDTVCNICLSYEPAKEFVAPICGHKFHDKCISQWLQNNETCPVCRKTVNSSIEKTHILQSNKDTITISNKFNKVKGYNNTETITIENIHDPMHELNDTTCELCNAKILEKIFITENEETWCYSCILNKKDSIIIENTIELCNALTIKCALPKKLKTINFGTNITIDTEINNSIQNVNAHSCVFIKPITIHDANEILFKDCVFKKTVIIKTPKKLCINNCVFSDNNDLKTIFKTLTPTMATLIIVIEKWSQPINIFDEYTLAQKTCFSDALKNMENIHLSFTKPLFINVSPNFSRAKKIEIKNVVFNSFPITNSDIEYLVLNRITFKGGCSLNFTKYEKLVYLHLENCKITDIQLPTKGLSMVFVQIKNCGLKAITKFPKNINYIGLPNNKLTVIPSIDSLDDCKTLDLENNRITTIGKPPRNLTILNVSNNRLTSINLSNTPNLHIIYLHKNLLTSFEYHAESDEINEILLYSNRLQTFKFTTNATKLIKHLHLSNNRLQRFSLPFLVRMKNIRLANNKLLDMVLANFAKTESLNVKNCYKLGEIRLTCATMGYLNIKHTSIKYIRNDIMTIVTKFISNLPRPPSKNITVYKLNDTNVYIKNKIILAKHKHHNSTIIYDPRIEVTALNLNEQVLVDDGACCYMGGCNCSDDESDEDGESSEGDSVDMTEFMFE